MKLHEKVAAIYWAFPHGDSRRDDILDLAKKVKECEESCEQWEREALKQRHVLKHMGDNPHMMTCENCGDEWEDRLCPVCREQEQAKARSEPIPGCDGHEPWRRP